MSKAIIKWRHVWKKWSTWLASVAGILAGLAAANPVLLSVIMAYFSPDARTFIAVLVGLLVFIVPVVTANIRQEKLNASG